MKIALLLNSTFDGDALEHRPLGGTETAALGVSRALAALHGVAVTLFSKTERPGRYNGVEHLPLHQLAAWSTLNEPDVLLVIRSWLPCWLPIKARCRVFLSPDAYDQPGVRSALTATIRVGGEVKDVTVLDPKLIFPSIDRFFCISEWQAQTFIGTLSIPAERIFVTGNGIFPENFAEVPLSERAPRLLYSATPFRGLEFMPGYFSALKRKHRELGFDVCSGMALYGHTREEDEAGYGALYDELRDSGASVHGPLEQRQLAELMSKARVYTYPNTFEETFCISVLEAQAAGLPVVTSKKAALTERIEHGIDGYLIDGHPSEHTYREAFLSTVDRLLKDPDLWETISTAARNTAMRQSYRQLAKSWMDCFDGLLKQREKPRQPEIPPIPAVAIAGTGTGEPALTIPGDKIAEHLPQAFREYGFT